MDSNKEEVKKQFTTREGMYRLMPLSEYSRPTNRVGYTNNNQNNSTQVKVSFIRLPDSSDNGDKICFNYAKELYIYDYKGLKKAPDLTKPIEKKIYKGTNPTCHDFNQMTVAHDSVSLLIGLSTGQVQLIEPIKREMSKLFNEEQLIDKTRVTCVRWAPGSTNLFLVSHASGQLYVYNEELMCGNTSPSYQQFKQGDGYTIYTCKTKSTRNPLYRWMIGAEGAAINEFAFSPNGTNLAIVSQDGFLRVFQYNTMELVGMARSYFGGFLCVCWSPDGKYIAVGGEDDLVTVWSFQERRVVARGQGHRSWVSVVAFDPYTMINFGGSNINQCQNGYEGSSSGGQTGEFSGSDDESQNILNNRNNSSNSKALAIGENWPNSNGGGLICYRLGSVGQDTQLCLWDLTEDVLRQPYICPNVKHKSPNPTSSDSGTNHNNNTITNKQNDIKLNDRNTASYTSTSIPNELVKKSKLGFKSLIINHTTESTNKVKLGSLKNNNLSSNLISPISNNISNCVNNPVTIVNSSSNNGNSVDKVDVSTVFISTNTIQRFPKEHKRNYSLTKETGADNELEKRGHLINKTLGVNSSDNVSVNNKLKSPSSKTSDSQILSSNSTTSLSTTDPMRLIGTTCCPRFDECPVVEPIVCKKIAHERLTALVFRKDCFVTACHDGYVYTWARPPLSGITSSSLNATSSPSTISVSMGSGSGSGGGPGGGTTIPIAPGTVV